MLWLCYGSNFLNSSSARTVFRRQILKGLRYVMWCLTPLLLIYVLISSGVWANYTWRISYAELLNQFDSSLRANTIISKRCNVTHAQMGWNLNFWIMHVWNETKPISHISLNRAMAMGVLCEINFRERNRELGFIGGDRLWTSESVVCRRHILTL